MKRSRDFVKSGCLSALQLACGSRSIRASLNPCTWSLALQSFGLALRANISGLRNQRQLFPAKRNVCLAQSRDGKLDGQLLRERLHCWRFLDEARNCASASFNWSESFTSWLTVATVPRVPCDVWRVMLEMICIAWANTFCAAQPAVWKRVKFLAPVRQTGERRSKSHRARVGLIGESCAAFHLPWCLLP